MLRKDNATHQNWSTAYSGPTAIYITLRQRAYSNAVSKVKSNLNLVLKL